MATKALALNPKQTATSILEALSRGLTEAARIYREYVDGGGDVLALHKSVPVSPSLWRNLDDVARGRVDVRTFALPGSVASAIRYLPAHTQTEVIDSGVDILSADGSARRIGIAELTPDQARQAFAVDHVRSPAEQAAWKDAEAKRVVPARNTSPADDVPTPTARGILFRGGLITWAQAVSLLAQRASGGK